MLALNSESLRHLGGRASDLSLALGIALRVLRCPCPALLQPGERERNAALLCIILWNLVRTLVLSSDSEVASGSRFKCVLVFSIRFCEVRCERCDLRYGVPIIYPSNTALLLYSVLVSFLKPYPCGRPEESQLPSVLG